MSGYVSYNLGLDLKQPRKGTRNFSLTMENDTYKKMSAHDHTGSGKGVLIGTNALAANAVNGSKLRLLNNTGLRSLDSASGDNDLLLMSGSDDTVLAYKSAKRLNFQCGGSVFNWLDQSPGTFVRKNHSNFSGSEQRTRSYAIKTTSATPVDLFATTISNDTALCLTIKLFTRSANGPAFSSVWTAQAAKDSGGLWKNPSGGTIADGTSEMLVFNGDVSIVSTTLSVEYAAAGVFKARLQSSGAFTQYHVMEVTSCLVGTDA